ncbi:serine/threonine-protein kinase HAL4/sat4 [Thoreauomyces humboldtii]|nr:serine/threonine-protein kinase HAL4/sat4 [Thoreauomyces humboldtii]
MEVHDDTRSRESSVDNRLALRKFPRIGGDWETTPRSVSSLSPSPCPSPGLSPVDGILPNCPARRSSTVSDASLHYVLPPNSLAFTSPTASKLSVDLGRLDESAREDVLSPIVESGSGSEIGARTTLSPLSSEVPVDDTADETRSSVGDFLQPATYIFSAAFSTHGRKNTLIKRLFHKTEATEMPHEIIVGRSAAGGYVTWDGRGSHALRKADEVDKANGHSDDSSVESDEEEDDNPSRPVAKSNSADLDHTPEVVESDKEGSKECPEAGRSKEEVHEYIHLLHYPGSQHSDHARTSLSRTRKKDHLIDKLFHRRTGEERGRKRDRVAKCSESDTSAAQSQTNSPTRENSSTTDPTFLPVIVQDKHIVASPTPHTGSGLLNFLHVTGRGRSNSSARSSVTTAPSYGASSNAAEESHAGKGYLNDLFGTHRRRGPSSTRGGQESDSDSIAGGTSTPGGTLHRKPSQKTLQRSPSESSMAEKYGKIGKNDVLGKGANAVVRLAHKSDAAHPEQAEARFAVKEFRKRRKGETQRDYIKKLIAEFCISSNMHHENVIQTVDLIQDERERWCEVMEYMPGGDLYTLIAGGGLTDPEEKACLFKQLITGVQYLHSVGVAHRDLKPENLLLDEKEQILKITDFGVSEVFRTCFEKSPRKASGVCGSEPYIAPEEWGSPGGYDATKADVWACGIILFTLLQATIPWSAARPTDPNYAKYSAFRTASSPTVTHGYGPFDRAAPGPRTLIYKMLDPDPTKRWSADELAAEPWFVAVQACRAGAIKHKHRS